MKELFLKNLRCFGSSLDWLKLAPLTLLVGENSAGKTTFLAATRLAWDLAYGHTEPDFNEEPFQLGAFDQLAHVFGGRRGRAKEIEVGHRSIVQKSQVEYRTTLTQDGSQARISKQVLRLPGLEITVTRKDSAFHVALNAEQGELFSKTLKEVGLPFAGTRWAWGTIFYLLQRELVTNKEHVAHKLLIKFWEQSHFFERPSIPRPYAFAPVRTKPLRTYDPIKQAPRPEGDHIPMVLARTYFTDDKSWGELRRGLEAFGETSGLFTTIDVRTLGKSESDPFQLRVKVGGPLVNLIDVGYGISQILPLLVEALSTNYSRRLMLMQQPEVHLHPRAQAELGSFLGTLVKQTTNRFVVETHSDHLIDRVRADVRSKRSLRAADVSILYFERRGGEAHIHQIGVDDNGDLTHVPDGYRSFFLAEERRILGL